MPGKETASLRDMSPFDSPSDRSGQESGESSPHSKGWRTIATSFQFLQPLHFGFGKEAPDLGQASGEVHARFAAAFALPGTVA